MSSYTPNFINPTLPAATALARQNLHFSGPGHIAKRRHLSGEAFEQLVGCYPKPYVGKLPAALLACGLSPLEVYASLDAIAAELLSLPASECKKAFPFSLGRETASLKYVASGRQGCVFQLQIRDQRFAFKICQRAPLLKWLENGPEKLFGVLAIPFQNLVKRHDEMLRNVGHGKFGETATGLFLSRWRIQDFSRFFCGNPVQGWMLDEWIDLRDRPDDRKGVRFDTIKQKYGLAETDDKGSNRNPHGIRWDRGGICTKERASEFTLISHFRKSKTKGACN